MQALEEEHVVALLCSRMEGNDLILPRLKRKELAVEGCVKKEGDPSAKHALPKEMHSAPPIKLPGWWQLRQSHTSAHHINGFVTSSTKRD